MKKKFLKIFIAYIAISLVAVNFAFVKVETAKAGSQIEINSCLELQSIGVAEGYPLDGSYILANDIDCSATSGWGDYVNGYCSNDFYNDETDCEDNSFVWTPGHYEGFNPIGLKGDEYSFFTGTLDGNNKTISNLYINRLSSDHGGLFSFISSATIYNLVFFNSKISSRNLVGSLAGSANSDASINNVVVRGYSTVFGNEVVGGLIGGADSASGIASSSFSGGVIGEDKVGGLVGNMAGGEISNSFSDAQINDDHSKAETKKIYSSGGLIGYSSYVDISNSYFSGYINYDYRSSQNVGGLAGYFKSGTIENCYVDTNEDNPEYGIKAQVNVGGLVGNLDSSKIIHSHSNIDVLSNNSFYWSSTGFGGLVGFSNRSEIFESYSGDISSTTDQVVRAYGGVGGIIGYAMNTKIHNSFSANSVYADTASGYFGPLIGDYAGNFLIDRSYSISKIERVDTSSNCFIDFYNSTAVTVKDSFYEAQTGTSSCDVIPGLEYKSPEEMKANTTFSSWNFFNIWEKEDGQYPTLRFFGSGQVELPETVYVNKNWTSTNFGIGLEWGKTAFNNIDFATEVIADGGTIYLKDSSDDDYDFTISEDINISEKAFSLVGEDTKGEEKVSILFQNGANIIINASNVSIENLKIDNISDRNQIISIESKTTISNIDISNNEINGSGTTRGIYIGASNLSGINILNNKISNNRDAIYFYSYGNYSGIVIEGNEIFNNLKGLSFETEISSEKIIIKNNKIYCTRL